MTDNTFAATSVCEPLYSENILSTAVGPQTDLVYLTALGYQEPVKRGDTRTVGSNEEAWELFRGERLRATHRLTLDHFHLFEWFPLCPGRFHLPWARDMRNNARAQQMEIDGDVCYTTHGKAMMLVGGVGAVRLRPARFDGADHYFMTASSTGVCHEGFPVAVPEPLFARVRDRIIEQGAVPVRLSGEMRFVPEDAVPLFDYRQVPLLMLRATELEPLPARRPGLDGFAVSVVVTFTGTVRGQTGAFVSYNTFDPANDKGLATATDWLGRVYIGREHSGIVVTDFDAVFPKFPKAKFGLPLLLGGTLDQDYLSAALQQLQIHANNSGPFIVKYVTIQKIKENYGNAIGVVARSSPKKRRTQKADPGETL
jgi:hypothetical protein